MTPVRKLAGHLGGLVAILFVWFLTMIASARFMPLSQDYLAVGAERRIVENLPPEAQILRTGSHTVVVTMSGDQAGKSLYAAGAWLVLPALANGCLALRQR